MNPFKRPDVDLAACWGRPPAQSSSPEDWVPRSADDALAEHGICWEEIGRWVEAGWLSFVPEPDCFLLWNEEWEIEIVCCLARSGMPEAMVRRALLALPRPLAVSPDMLALSFKYGWVVPADQEQAGRDELLVRQLRKRVDELCEVEFQESAAKMLAAILGGFQDSPWLAARALMSHVIRPYARSEDAEILAGIADVALDRICQLGLFADEGDTVNTVTAIALSCIETLQAPDNIERISQIADAAAQAKIELAGDEGMNLEDGSPLVESEFVLDNRKEQIEAYVNLLRAREEVARLRALRELVQGALDEVEEPDSDESEDVEEIIDLEDEYADQETNDEDEDLHN